MPTLRWYNPPGSKKGLLAQYAAHSGRIKGAIRGVIEEWWRLENREQAPFKWLIGACAGLFELEVDVEGKVFRVLGFKGPNRGEYTIVTAFEKTLGVASYNAPCRQAFNREKGVKKDGRRAPECPFR